MENGFVPVPLPVPLPEFINRFRILFSSWSLRNKKTEKIKLPGTGTATHTITHKSNKQFNAEALRREDTEENCIQGI